MMIILGMPLHVTNKIQALMSAMGFLPTSSGPPDVPTVAKPKNPRVTKRAARRESGVKLHGAEKEGNTSRVSWPTCEMI